MSARENYRKAQDALFPLLIADPWREEYPEGILETPEGAAEYNRRADAIVEQYGRDCAREDRPLRRGEQALL